MNCKQKAILNFADHDFQCVAVSTETFNGKVWRCKDCGAVAAVGTLRSDRVVLGEPSKEWFSYD